MSQLKQLRSRLSSQGTDLQRAYLFNFRSFKIGLFNINVFILSVQHPQIQYDNDGVYKGFIAGAKKPNEISISFLETESQDVTKFLNLWDSLKYDAKTGILYPKAVYEDTAILTYYSTLSGEELFSTGSKQNLGQVAKSIRDKAQSIVTTAITFSPTKEGIQGISQNNPESWRRGKSYVFEGFYPIQRDSIELSYGNNSLITINCTFNVDNVKPMTEVISGSGR